MNGECRSCGYPTTNPDHVCPGTTNMDEWPVLADAFQEYMSAISEEHYCASWLNGLEYDLWTIAMSDGNPRWGQYVISESKKKALRAFSEQCNGWMMRWNRYVPMDQWTRVMSREWV